MKITKKDTYSVIGSDQDENDQEILYCPFCAKYNVSKVLTYRQNYNASDRELWRYCDNCKRVMPATTGRRSSMLKGVVDPIETPFDTANIVGIDNKKPQTPQQKYRKQLLEKANKEKDAEVRREILKGNIIEDT